ncbi:hypothetical protein BGW38_006024, partial [Lunasporangiospora selenospora]
MADEKQKHLVFSILEFLQSSLGNGTIKADDAEGIEVAIQCIGEAFGVDPSDAAQAQKYSTKPATLVSIFDVFVNAQKKLGSKAAPAASSSTSSAPAAAMPARKEPTDEEKKNAEELKVAGNRKVNEKDYAEAIRLYGEAIVLNSNNAVYYANRRLGHAYFSVGKFKEAVSAYEKGLALEPNNTTMKSSLATARTKARDNEVAPAPRSGGSPLGAGLEGLGGAGGMPDLAGMLNNPALM